MVENRTEVNEQPCEIQMLVANDLEEAYQMAREMRNLLRWGAVHKETVVRDITLLYTNVMVTKWEEGMER